MNKNSKLMVHNQNDCNWQPKKCRLKHKQNNYLPKKLLNLWIFSLMKRSLDAITSRISVRICCRFGSELESRTLINAYSTCSHNCTSKYGSRLSVNAYGRNRLFGCLFTFIYLPHTNVYIVLAMQNKSIWCFHGRCSIISVHMKLRVSNVTVNVWLAG